MGFICKLKKFVFGCEKENIIKVKRFVNGVLLPKMGVQPLPEWIFTNRKALL